MSDVCTSPKFVSLSMTIVLLPIISSQTKNYNLMQLASYERNKLQLIFLTLLALKFLYFNFLRKSILSKLAIYTLKNNYVINGNVLLIFSTNLLLISHIFTLNNSHIYHTLLTYLPQITYIFTINYISNKSGHI